MTDRFIIVSEIVESNGKTVRENNLAIAHRIPIGTLVEVRSEDEDYPWNGARLYVCTHGRDCDGSPLYGLGPKGSTDLPEIQFGFSDDNLQEVST